MTPRSSPNWPTTISYFRLVRIPRILRSNTDHNTCTIHNTSCFFFSHRWNRSSRCSWRTARTRTTRTRRGLVLCTVLPPKETTTPSSFSWACRRSWSWILGTAGATRHCKLRHDSLLWKRPLIRSQNWNTINCEQNANATGIAHSL